MDSPAGLVVNVWVGGGAVKLAVTVAGPVIVIVLPESVPPVLV
jgi:hypothetical protein